MRQFAAAPSGSGEDFTESLWVCEGLPLGVGLQKLSEFCFVGSGLNVKVNTLTRPLDVVN